MFADLILIMSIAWIIVFLVRIATVVTFITCILSVCALTFALLMGIFIKKN